MGRFLSTITRKLSGMGLFRTKPVDQLQDDEGDGGHRLKRELGPIDAISLGIACIIGTGIFVMPGVVAAKDAGPGIILSFGISGLACLFVMFCYLELTGMISKGGSAYTYASATLGELVAWIIGWDLLLEYAIGGSAVAAGWSAYLQSLLGTIHIDLLGVQIAGIKLPAFLASAPHDMPWSYVLMAAAGLVGGGICWRNFGSPFNLSDGRNTLGKLFTVPVILGGGYGLFMAATHITSIDILAMGIVTGLSIMLAWGVKQTARMTTLFVVIKLAVIVLFIVVGIGHVDTANYSPFLPYGLAGAFAGAVPAFFAYIGFDAVSTLPEDCKNPKRDVPIGIAGSLAISSVLYMAVAAIMVGCVSYGLLNTAAPMALVFDKIGAGWAVPLIGLGAIAGITSVLIVLLLGQSRVMMSMSRDGLVSPVFAKIHPRLQTPVASIAVLGLAVGLPAGLIPIDELADLTSIGTLFAFLIVCVGVMVLRRTEPDRERKFRVPFSNSKRSVRAFGVTWTTADIFPILGVFSSALLMYFVKAVTWDRFIIWLVAGFVIYFAYSRFHSVLNPNNQKPNDKK
jgi:APA family basic amino acid/polyamine antiporter